MVGWLSQGLVWVRVPRGDDSWTGSVLAENFSSGGFGSSRVGVSFRLSVGGGFVFLFFVLKTKKNSVEGLICFRVGLGQSASSVFPNAVREFSPIPFLPNLPWPMLVVPGISLVPVSIFSGLFSFSLFGFIQLTSHQLC